MVVGAQQLLEARASALADGESFGAFDDWLLQLDEHLLVLHPPTQEWLRYDDAHDSWVQTTVRAGDGTFVVVDGRLAVQRVPSTPTQAAPLAPVTSRRSALRTLRTLLLVVGVAASGFSVYSMVTSDDDDGPSCTGGAWSLQVPDGWRDVTSGACTAFGHESGGATIGIGVVDRGLDELLAAYDDVLEQQDTAVDGVRAVRVVRGTGADGDDADYVYLVDLDGRTLRLDSFAVSAAVSQVVSDALDDFAAALMLVR